MHTRLFAQAGSPIESTLGPESGATVLNLRHHYWSPSEKRTKCSSCSRLARLTSYHSLSTYSFANLRRLSSHLTTGRPRDRPRQRGPMHLCCWVLCIGTCARSLTRKPSRSLLRPIQARPVTLVSQIHASTSKPSGHSSVCAHQKIIAPWRVPSSSSRCEAAEWSSGY